MKNIFVVLLAYLVGSGKPHFGFFVLLHSNSQTHFTKNNIKQKIIDLARNIYLLLQLILKSCAGILATLTYSLRICENIIIY